VKPNWDSNGADTQALILAYDQTCEHEENEETNNMLKAGGFSKRRR
jgi:hypothetical protein